jgi:hypothetical protein
MIAALESSVQEVRDRAGEVGATLDLRAAELAGARERIAALEASLAERERARVELTGIRERIVVLEASLAERDSATAELTAAREQIAALQASLSWRDRELAVYKEWITKIKAFLSWRLMAPFRALYRPIRRLQGTRLGIKVAAAWRHPANSRKRKAYRANRLRSPPPRKPPRLRPTNSIARLRALARHPFSGRLRKEYRHHLLGGAASSTASPLQTGERAVQPRSCLIVTTPHALHYARLMAKHLREEQFNVDIEHNTLHSDKYEYAIIISPQMFNALPPKYIAVQMEQAVSSRWFTDDYLTTLRSAQAIVDYSPFNIQHLTNSGVPYDKTFYVPAGISIDLYREYRSMRLAKGDLPACKILFYGDDQCKRREEFLKRISQEFDLTIINNTFGDEMVVRCRVEHSLLRRGSARDYSHIRGLVGWCTHR